MKALLVNQIVSVLVKMARQSRREYIREYRRTGDYELSRGDRIYSFAYMAAARRIKSEFGGSL